MARAAKACSDPYCAHLQPCPIHKSTPWSGGRNTRIKNRSGSKEQRTNRYVMRKYSGICHVCHLPGADEVDHVIPLAGGGADGLSNRRPIHSKPCHQDKTRAEAQRARQR